MSKTRSQIAATAEEQKQDSIVEGIRESVAETVEQVGTKITDSVRQANTVNRVMPEYFDGVGQDPYHWLQTFELLAELNRWSDKEKILYFRLAMKGEGTAWLTTYIIPTSGDTFDGRKQCFLDFYGADNDQLILAFQRCKQGLDESSKMYASRFLTLASRVGTTMSEREKILQFMKGLRPELRRAVAFAGITSINDILRISRTQELCDALDQEEAGQPYAHAQINNINRMKNNNNNNINNDKTITNNNNNNANTTTNKDYTNKNNNTKNNNNKQTTFSNQEDTVNVKHFHSIDQKLDNVVSAVHENTSSIGLLTTTLQQTYLQQTQSRARLDQPYVPPNINNNNNNNSNNNTYSRPRPHLFCAFCNKYTYTHETEQCFANPKNPNYNPNWIPRNAQRSVPSAPNQQQSHQDVRVQPTNTSQNIAPANIPAHSQQVQIQSMETQPPTQQPISNSSVTGMRHVGTFTVKNENPTVKKLFTAEAFIGNVKVENALIDTGAEVSAISLNFFKQLPPDIKKKINRNTTFRAVNATMKVMELAGYIEVSIQIGSYPKIGNTLELEKVGLVIVKDLSTDCLIGQDILEKYFDYLHFAERRLYYGSCWNKSYWIHLTFPPVRTYDMIDEKTAVPVQSIFNLMLAKSVRVRPNQSLLVRAAVIDDGALLRRVIKQNPSLTAAFLDASDHVKKQTDGAISVHNGLYDTQEIVNANRVLIQFNNTSSQTVRIRKRTALGLIHLSNDEDLNIRFISYDDKKESPISNINSITVKDDVSDEPIDHYLPIQPAEAKTKDIISTIDFSKADITKEQLRTLIDTLEAYRDRFAEDPQNPSRTSLIEHEIHTEDHPPIRAPLKRFPPNEEEFISTKVNEMLRNGTIIRSRSAWASRPALALKANGELRFCVNYIPLNRITKFDAFPIPNADALLDCFRSASIFSSLDLAAGYWQIRMKSEHAEKTAFITKQGLFEFVVMPFGLKTAPATFVRLMNDVFAKVLWRFVVIYFDDIIIFSNSFQEHLEHIKIVMQLLRDADLQAKSTKCTFCVVEVSFLSYIVSAGGLIKTNPNKIKAIAEMPAPGTPTELRSALGLMNYYRRFVQDYAAIAAPLYRLTSLKSDIEYWPWDAECEKAFQTLKQKLISAPILYSPDWDQPFIIYTDASIYAMGAILAQVLDKTERVIRYWSRVLNSAQRRYSTTEREALAIVCAIREFNCYVGGRPFTVVTDHKPLVGLKDHKDPHGRIARWMLEFQSHTFDIMYRSGEKNHVDALSRMVPPTQDMLDIISINNIDTDTEYTPPSGILIDEDDAEDINNSDSEQSNNEEDEPEISDEDTLEEKETEELLHEETVTYEVNDKVILRTNDQQGQSDRIYTITERLNPIHYRLKADDDESVIIEQPISNIIRYYNPVERMRYGIPDIDIVGNIQLFNAAQRADTALSPIITYLIEHKFPEDVRDYQQNEIVSVSRDCHIDNNGTLIRTFQPTNGRTKLDVIQQVALPQNILPKLMHEFHDSPLAGHIGITKTYNKIRERYWWPHMIRDITNYIKTCDLCQRRKSPRKLRWPIRSILPTPDKQQSNDKDESIVYLPFSEVVVDVLGPLPQTARRKKFIVIFIDRLTRWPEAYATTNLRGKTIALLIMNEIIPRYGVPRTLLSDQGSNFLGKICTKLYDLMRIHKLQTSAYFPSCNGLVERFNRTIVNMLAMFVQEQQNDWDLYIPWVLFAYRTAVNVSTHYSPFYLLHGYDATYPMDIELRLLNETFNNKEKFVEFMAERVATAREVAVKNLAVIDNQLMEKYRKLPKLPHYNIGDLVLVYDPTTPPGTNPKLMRRWTGPYRILKRFSNVNYEVKAINPKSDRVRQVKKVHVYRMRPYQQPLRDNTNAIISSQQQQSPQPNQQSPANSN